MKIPGNIEAVLSRLGGAGYEAYIVGGCVRDALMGLEPHDYDVTTSALPEQVSVVFSDKKVIETGLKHGTVTVLYDGEPIEITTFRVDGEYLDCRRPETVSFTSSIKEDISRRDFTINGIAYNPESGLYDAFGGEEDIKRGVIRCIGDPDKRFGEDALRILRALRFSASLGFAVEDNTAGSIRRNAEKLKKVSCERILSELMRMFCGRYSHLNLNRVLTEYRDVFAVVIPELEPLFDYDQRSPYHDLDLYRHTAKSVEAAAGITRGEERSFTLTLAMLLHDIAKPECMTEGEDGIRHYYGHAEAGARKADAILRRLKCSNALRERVCGIIKYHDAQMPTSDRTIRRLLSKLGLELFTDAALAHCADDAAKRAPYNERKDSYLAVIERAKQLSEKGGLDLKGLAVDGRALLGITPQSPLIGETLGYLLDGVVDGRFPNEKDFLMNEAAKYIANKKKL